MRVHLTQFAKNLLSRLSSDTSQLFRHIRQPARPHGVTDTLADLLRNGIEYEKIIADWFGCCAWPDHRRRVISGMRCAGQCAINLWSQQLCATQSVV
jgi:hypothetical protein